MHIAGTKSCFLNPVIAALVMLSAVATASANGLRVEPVSLDVNSSQIATSLTLRNDDDFNVSVQTRIFRWTQQDGVEHLEPAPDVAVSPPIVTLTSQGNYTVRVVRTAKTEVLGEEAYRVWVDQLPDPRQRADSEVKILIRQSIPVFFHNRQSTRARVSWSLRMDNGKLLIVARNAGDERLRVASLHLRDRSGRTATFGDGLVGYVLGRSTMVFTLPKPPTGFGRDGEISIAAESNVGAIHAMASFRSRP